MKKKLKLKPYVLPSVYVLFVAVLTVGAYFVMRNMQEEQTEPMYNYVSKTIVEKEIPVLNETTKMIKPFTSEGVEIGKYFYDYQGQKEMQEKSLTKHENTYIQNSGVDYTAKEVFDVVAVLDGTVTKVTEDELLGKTVEIKHEDEYITVYQSLSEVSVKKGDVINQGQIIGKSGSNEMDKDLGNHLHFELYFKGSVVNPLDYIDKELKQEGE